MIKKFFLTIGTVITLLILFFILDGISGDEEVGLWGASGAWVLTIVGSVAFAILLISLAFRYFRKSKRS